MRVDIWYCRACHDCTAINTKGVNDATRKSQEAMLGLVGAIMFMFVCGQFLPILIPIVLVLGIVGFVLALVFGILLSPILVPLLCGYGIYMAVKK